MNQHSSSSGSLPSQTDIVALAKQYVLNLFNQKNNSRLVYHTYKQTTEIARMVNVIAEAVGAPRSDWETAELAAWFVNVGYLLNYKRPEQKGMEVADKFLSAHQYPENRKKEFLDTLKEVLQRKPANSGAGQLLSDAVNAVTFGADFFQNAPHLQAERELLLKLHYSPEEWDQYLLQQLMDVRFFSAYAKVHCEPLAASHLVQLKEKIESQKKANKKQFEERKKKEEDTQAVSGKEVSPASFWAINYHNHLRLSTLADNKAHVMIGVNAVLIALIIGMALYSDATDNKPSLLMPAFLFVATGLGSLICAVLAVKPRVTSVVQEASPLDEAKRNIMFFGNFVAMEPEKFEQLLGEVMKDKALLQHNFISDLYHLGKVLDEKYRYLSYSYTLFLFGFAASVLAFLVVLVA